MLRLPQMQHYSEEDVKYVVETNDKQRFQLEMDAGTGRLKIRANQGHTVAVGVFVLHSFVYLFILFYYENRTQSTVNKSIKQLTKLNNTINSSQQQQQ